MRAVLDTNVLIDGFSDDFSAQAKLVEAVHNEELIALSTAALEREYRKILHRLIKDDGYRDKIEDFIAATEPVAESFIDVQIDDLEDLKFVKAAVGGQADVLVTKDRHLLDLGEVEQTRIVTPQEAWVLFQEERGDSAEWQEWARGLGIGQ